MARRSMAALGTDDSRSLRCTTALPASSGDADTSASERDQAACMPCVAQLNSPADRLVALLTLIASETEPIVTLTHLLPRPHRADRSLFRTRPGRRALRSEICRDHRGPPPRNQPRCLVQRFLQPASWSRPSWAGAPWDSSPTLLARKRSPAQFEYLLTSSPNCPAEFSAVLKPARAPLGSSSTELLSGR